MLNSRSLPLYVVAFMINTHTTGGNATWILISEEGNYARTFT
nr:MAG TPA: hypothetical protein [Caudoviricetes sp.]